MEQRQQQLPEEGLVLRINDSCLALIGPKLVLNGFKTAELSRVFDSIFFFPIISFSTSDFFPLLFERKSL